MLGPSKKLIFSTNEEQKRSKAKEKKKRRNKQKETQTKKEEKTRAMVCVCNSYVKKKERKLTQADLDPVHPLPFYSLWP